MQEFNGKLVPGEPKTESGARQVQLPSIAVQALRDHREKMLAEGHAHDYVFCDTIGGPICKGNLLRRSFKPILVAAGLPDIRFHDLRHSAATLVLGMWIHHKIVQEILGHSTFMITMDTYSHVSPTMQQDAAEKMDTLLRSLHR